MTQSATDKKPDALAKVAPVQNKLAAFLNAPEVQAKLAEVAKSIDPRDLVRLTLAAATKQPDLMACTMPSILRALLDAAALGIRPGGLMGRGYLVPRKGECCFDPGWRGLVDIARRSGQIKTIDAHVVYEREKFRVLYGTDPVLEHEPSLAADRGKIVAAYAIATFKDGAKQVEVLARADLDKIRAVSAAKNNGPWGSWEDEMSRKSAVRRLCKYLPFDPLLEKAIEAADRAEGVNFREAHFTADIAVGDAQALEDQLMGTPASTVTHDEDGVVGESK